MDKVAIGFFSVFMLLTGEANAQNVVNRATSTVAGAGSAAGAGSGASGAGASLTGSPAGGASGAGLVGGSAAGGSLPGALQFKAGDKVIQFRGAAGVGDDRGNFKAGLGIPF
jgi:hypothetical protein